MIYPHFLVKKLSEMKYNYPCKHMKENLILQDKNFISAKRAAEISSYTSDYIGQLCRGGKLECKMIGRSWFVTQESLLNHQLAFSPELAPKLQSFIDAQKAEVKNVVEETSKVEEISIPTPVQISAPILSPIVSSAMTPEPVSFVPRSFALPYYISENFLTSSAHKASRIFSPDTTKLTFAAGVCALSLVFVFQSLSLNTTIVSNISSNPVTASVLSSSEEVVRKVISFFSAIPQLAINIFGENSELASNNAVTEISPKGEDDSLGFKGLAVVPSTNDPIKDEIIKDQIRASFSDEVKVKPDQSKTAGIITPVFKKAQGDDFIYVLVPNITTN